MKTTVEILRLENNDQPLPHYQTEFSAGMDLHANVKEPFVLRPGAVTLVPTGFAVAIPTGYEIQIRPRSGLAAKFGVTVVNSPGTIDADYRGEIKVALINLSNSDFVVDRGMRIAQAVLSQVPVCVWSEVKELSATNRGEGGFGSTGTQKVG